MRERVYEHYVYCHDVGARNPHCLDEMTILPNSSHFTAKRMWCGCRNLPTTVDTNPQKVAAGWSAVLSEPRQKSSFVERC